MFIVLEGIDGGGKSVQAEILSKKYGWKLFKYPTRKFNEINDFLEKKTSPDSRSLFLFFLADIIEDQQNVRKELSAGKNVVMDRYCLSTIAYGFDYERGKEIVRLVEPLIPDKIILFDISIRGSMERKSRQKTLDRYEEDVRWLENVGKNYLKLENERFLTPNWYKINADRPVETVSADIARILRIP